MFWRHWIGADLTPHEHAIVAFIEAAVGAGFISGVVALQQYLVGGGLNNRVDIALILGAFFTAFWSGLLAYVKAHGQGSLTLLKSAQAGSSAANMPATVAPPATVLLPAVGAAGLTPPGWLNDKPAGPGASTYPPGYGVIPPVAPGK